MTMFDFLQHINISMMITGLIGFFGNMYEPGPVPKLMMVVAGLYLFAYFIGVSVFAFWRYEHDRDIINRYSQHDQKASEILYMELATPREKEQREFQMFDLKEA